MPAPSTATTSVLAAAAPSTRVERAGHRLDGDRVGIAQASSGTAYSWLSWATRPAVDQPPPVSAQKPVWIPGARCPKAMCSQSPVWPPAHDGAQRLDPPGPAAEHRLDDHPGAAGASSVPSAR